MPHPRLECCTLHGLTSSFFVVVVSTALQYIFCFEGLTPTNSVVLPKRNESEHRYNLVDHSQQNAAKLFFPYPEACYLVIQEVVLLVQEVGVRIAV